MESNPRAIRLASGAAPEPFGSRSGISPVSFQTSRARADQGAGNKGAWNGSGRELASHLANVDTREDSLVSVSQALAAGLWVTDKRHDVIRSGEREPIPPHVRTAVWYRDHGKCELCADRVEGMWHLDHITPWSAGGSDQTTNLRVLCERHNIERSNYVDPTERPRQPATWWCYRCYGRDGESWDYTPSGYAMCPIHNRFPGRCRVMAGYGRMAEQTGEYPTWHQREYIDEPDATVIAYCAHCNAPSLTDRPL